MSLELEEISLQQRFEEVIASENKLAIQDFLNHQNISDVATLIYDNEEYEGQIISHLSIHRAASVFKILESPTQKRLIKGLPTLKTTELLNELPADDRVAFLEELPTSIVRDLIKTLDPDERKVTLELLGYPENSVGRLMTPDFVYVYEENTVAEVFDTIRKHAKSSETIDVIYVINERDELLDDIRIRDFILAQPNTKVKEIMDGRFISLHVNDDQETASEIFKMNNRVALPVTGDNNILLGIVTIDDVLWVAEEEFSEDIQKIGGTQALDEPYLEMPLIKLFKKRIGWLVVLFLGEMLTATAMGYFEGEIQKFVVLALFIPLIISSGGNTGSQASTLIIQAMAVGEITVASWWRVIRREIIQGVMLGSVLGIIGFIRVIAWARIVPGVYGEHEVRVAFTVGFALLGVVLWGTLSGSMLPMVLKKAGADPAVSSAPFVATLVDVTGLIIYFSVAYFFLKGILL
ncbi:MAG TPA: magnesium transporter [Ferruginibacter sp.]|jgi:magnesium transporter|nr:magnesium transporter [Ferruginibacter sp.]MBN8699929.1 magnesium transporter [Chitinophagales bacterium]HMU71211.1 magnesium transporter [Ferruginibacter sp.]HMX79831.1 magnesium transporter [Ferruginibacter sp.]HMZ99421.1 magnesium transporter [Ferruginibacter sp.]